MKTSMFKITAGDGIELAVSHYQAGDAASRRVAIVLGATGVTQERYASFARFLAQEGWHVLTFDYRGIGRSVVSLAQRDRLSMQAWGEQDVTALIDWATSRFQPERLVVIAHSIGGQIIPLATNHARIDAVLALAVQKGYWKLWDAPNRYLVYGFFRVYTPLCLKLFGRVPLKFAGLDPLHRGIALDYARWTLRTDYRSASGESLVDRFAAFSAPILSLSFDDDTKYAPKRTVDFLMRHYYLQAPVLRCHIVPRHLGIPGLGHSGFFDPGRCPRDYWQEVSAWLKRVSREQPLANYPFTALPNVQPLLGKMPLDGALDAVEPKRHAVTG